MCCLFKCKGHCLKVVVTRQEHLLGVNKSRLKGNAKPLLVKDQIAIGKLEKQTEDFLNAVFCRKGESVFFRLWLHSCVVFLLTNNEQFV